MVHHLLFIQLIFIKNSFVPNSFLGAENVAMKTAKVFSYSSIYISLGEASDHVPTVRGGSNEYTKKNMRELVAFEIPYMFQ